MEMYIKFTVKNGISFSFGYDRDIYYADSAVKFVFDIKNGKSSQCPLDGALDILLNDSKWLLSEKDIVNTLIESIQEYSSAK